MSDVDFASDAFHAGDARLFSRLVRAYSPRLLPLLRRYATDDAEAHDLLQDVWLRAYTKRASFRADGSLLGWLLSIARSIGLSHIQKQKRVALVEIEAAHAIVRGEDEDERIDRTGQRRRLRDAVAQLPDRQRDVVVLRIIEGKSTAQAASAMNCAQGTVKAALHQALRKLQQQLSPVSNP